jgi:pimeloyl-ACP methyl ester carboxylesterase
MLGFRFKALNDNNFNTTTRPQQTHNNFYSVEFQLQQTRPLLCFCCVCNILTTCILTSFTTKAYERALSKLEPGQTGLAPEAADGRLPPTPFVEAHYIRNDFFLQPGQLLRDAAHLKGIPGVIVQGRYDLLCPPKHAFALSDAWSDGRLQMMEHAGHCMSEPGVADAMAEAVRDLSKPT